MPFLILYMYTTQWTQLSFVCRPIIARSIRTYIIQDFVLREHVWLVVTEDHPDLCSGFLDDHTSVNIRLVTASSTYLSRNAHKHVKTHTRTWPRESGASPPAPPPSRAAGGEISFLQHLGCDSGHQYYRSSFFFPIPSFPPLPSESFVCFLALAFCATAALTAFLPRERE